MCHCFNKFRFKIIFPLIFITLFSSHSVFALFTSGDCVSEVNRLLFEIKATDEMRLNVNFVLKSKIGEFFKRVIKRLRNNDEYTYHHSQDVMQISVKFAHYLGLSDEDLIKVFFAALIHDGGKHKVPAKTLNFPGRLSQQQFAEVRPHPLTLFNLMRRHKRFIPAELHGFWDDISQMATQHHEKVDGNGYPFGLHGDQLHPLSRILVLADAWSSIRGRRAYSDAETNLKKAIEMLEEGVVGSGTRFAGAFNKEDVEIFIALVKNKQLDSMMVPPLKDVRELGFYLGRPKYFSIGGLLSDVPNIKEGRKDLALFLKYISDEELERWVQHWINVRYLKYGRLVENRPENLKFSTTAKLKSDYFKNLNNQDSPGYLLEWINELHHNHNVSELMIEGDDTSRTNHLLNFNYFTHEDILALSFLMEWQKRL